MASLLMAHVLGLTLAQPAPTLPPRHPSLQPDLELALATPLAPPESPTGEPGTPTLTTRLGEQAGGTGSTPSSATAEGEQGGLTQILSEEGRSLARLRRTHHALGIATWAAMLVTATIGTVQFVDMYGTSQESGTRCEQGDPLLGDWNCDFPFLHMSFVVTTVALYFTSFGLGRAVYEQTSATSDGASPTRRQRAHRALAWTHLAGIVYQVLGGLIFANLDTLGLDSPNTYDIMRGLFFSHMVVGWLTFGALTGAWAAMPAG